MKDKQSLFSRKLENENRNTRKNNLKISIVVPVYNEEEILASFIREVILYLEIKDISYEILLVENGSIDYSKNIISSFSNKNNKISGLFLDYPSYGDALRYGLNKAKGEFIVIFNVDFWDKRLIDLCRRDLDGVDVVSASKNLPGSRDKRPLTRRIITKTFGIILRKIFGYKGSDTHGIKVFRRDRISPIVKKCKLRSGIFDSELMIRAQREGLKMREIPVRIKEIRPPRFKGRFYKTFFDVCELFIILRR